MRTSSARTCVVLGVLLAVCVIPPLLSGGGFDATSRLWFVLGAGVALIASAMLESHTAARVVRTPLAMTLIALGGWSAASGAWAAGSSTAAVRWGLVVGGYAAVVIAAATVVQMTGPWPVAAGIAALAALEAILGLQAVAFHALPEAERLGRAWRPGGSFEYPPALATLELGALPIMTVAMDRGRGAVAGAAAVGVALAGMVLWVAHSRLALVLTGAVLLALLLRPPPGRYPRATVVMTTLLVCVGGLLAPRILGGSVGPSTPGAGTVGMAEVAGVAVVSGLSWLVIRRFILGRGGPARRDRLAIAAILAGAIALGGVASTSTAADPSHLRPSGADARTPPTTNLLHGRSQEWSAAVETWLDRPLLGAGAGSYSVASLSHQGGAGPLYAHDLPLELAAELGVVGLLAALALYASAGWTVAQARGTIGIWLFGPLVVVFLISNLVDWTWHLAGLGSIWAAAGGALTAANRQFGTGTD